MANMKDIARVTGLSLATVSRAFNEPNMVSPKTRNIVLKAASELNFRPNKMASALRSGKSKTIGVVVPIIDRDVFSAAIKKMEEVFSEADYHLVICQSHESVEKEKEIIENLKQLRVDGIIISVSKQTRAAKHIQSLKDAGLPVVLFDRTVDIDAINAVIINNFNGSYQATTHLIEQGCKSIIHLGGNFSVGIFRERKRGFEAAMREHGHTLSPSSVIEFDDGDDTGMNILMDRLKGPAIPDGIVAHGDISALVAIRTIRQLGMKIPEDIAIIGFGDSNFCPHTDPSLSSVSQRNEDIGKLAATTMLEELQSKNKEELVYTQQVLPPKVVVRASSKKR